MEHLLVIDNDIYVYEELKNILAQEKYKITAAASAEEGIKIIKQSPPDLIICDIIMEKMNGVELLKKIMDMKADIPVIMVSAYGAHDNVIQALELGALDFVAKPFNQSIINVIKKAIAFSRMPKEEKAHMRENEMSPIRRLLRDSYMSVLKSFAIIIESKDPYLKRHSLRVTEYAVALAEKLGLNPEEVEIIGNTSRFHDIGKIGISDTILQKPGELTADEWDEIKKHPQIGYDIIEPLKLIGIALPGIKHHHERFDGNGYPDGLKGENIPLSARILAIADAYEALTSDRPYRKGKSSKEAAAEIKRNAGSQFDPKLADIFIKILKERAELTD